MLGSVSVMFLKFNVPYENYCVSFRTSGRVTSEDTLYILSSTYLMYNHSQLFIQFSVSSVLLSPSSSLLFPSCSTSSVDSTG